MSNSIYYLSYPPPLQLHHYHLLLPRLQRLKEGLGLLDYGGGGSDPGGMPFLIKHCLVGVSRWLVVPECAWDGVICRTRAQKISLYSFSPHRSPSHYHHSYFPWPLSHLGCRT